ncbi:hypothetical protein M3210_10495 [Oceanobacillus luteolus]|uniref:Uncharacterized protein n=1 Tax=Oceanobacillus luteolus TaxID=1274358 RepID=A0ABW4HMD4_9BACI|nr:hypothetical protein [Oceanobacillus luteolus]
MIVSNLKFSKNITWPGSDCDAKEVINMLESMNWIGFLPPILFLIIIVFLVYHAWKRS